jgi:hypothetical protein
MSFTRNDFHTVGMVVLATALGSLLYRVRVVEAELARVRAVCEAKP